MGMAGKVRVSLLVGLLVLGAHQVRAASLESGIAAVDAMLVKEDYVGVARLLLDLEAEHPRSPEVLERMKRFTMIVQLRKDLDRPVSVFVPGYAQKTLDDYEVLRKYFNPTDGEVFVAFLATASLVLSAEVVTGWVKKQTARAEDQERQGRSGQVASCIKRIREGSYRGA